MAGAPACGAGARGQGVVRLCHCSTDWRGLDKQIRDTIKQFAQVSAIVGHAGHSGDLCRFLKAEKIIITTAQKFPFILDEIGDEHRKSQFAIIINSPHSGQGGKTTAAMNMVVAEKPNEYKPE